MTSMGMHHENHTVVLNGFPKLVLSYAGYIQYIEEAGLKL